MKQTTSKEITVKAGDYVEMPEPDEKLGDCWTYTFAGHVDGFRNGHAIVVDGDGDCFDVEPERLTILRD